MAPEGGKETVEMLPERLALADRIARLGAVKVK
jgi:hypothetical protein